LSALVYLFAAYAAAVLLIGGYLVYVVTRVSGMRAELERLKREETPPARP
jgi:CcmD family protein